MKKGVGLLIIFWLVSSQLISPPLSHAASCDPTSFNQGKEHSVAGPNGFLGTTRVSCPAGECEANASASCSNPLVGGGLCVLSCWPPGATTEDPTLVCPGGYHTSIVPGTDKNKCYKNGCMNEFVCDTVPPLDYTCQSTANYTFTYDSALGTCTVGKKTAVFLCLTEKCDTAIGQIPVQDLPGFLRFLLRFAFGIAGGIILLMLILTGYNILTSSGNPEKLQAAKENLVSIFTGLILIFFSVVLLQAIGAGILNLPTF